MSQSFSISFAFNSSWNSQNRKTLCPNVSRLQTQSVNGNGIERYFQKWKEWLWKGSRGYCLHHCIGLNPSLNYYAQEMILTPRMSCKIGRKPSSQVATILVLEMNPLLLKTSCCLLLVSKWCSGELLQTLWKLPFTSNGLNACHVFNVSHPLSPTFWDICFMCGHFGFVHFVAHWFDFCQIVISEDRVTSFSRRA